MKVWVLIVISFLAIATIIVWTFATAALYRRGQCRVYPYYWCDTNWKCCNAANSNQDCEDAGGTSDKGSYKITDKFYGTNTNASLGDDDHNLYYHLCIAPANSIIAANPGTSLACLYSPGPNGPVSCTNYLPSSIPNIDPTLPPYNNGQYDKSDCLSNPIGPGCYGLQGRCTYTNIDDADAHPTNPSSYTYLPGYSNGSITNTSGNGYYTQPYLGSPLNQTNYFFAGNSKPGDSPSNGFNNGPNQADSTFYSAWNRLGNPRSGV